MRSKVEIGFMKWFDDYLDDLGKTGTRLLECGVSYIKVKRIIDYSVKEVLSEAITVNTHFDMGEE